MYPLRLVSALLKIEEGVDAGEAVAEEEEQLGAELEEEAEEAELSRKSSSSINCLLHSSLAVKMVAGQLRSSRTNQNST